MAAVRKVPDQRAFGRINAELFELGWACMSSCSSSVPPTEQHSQVQKRIAQIAELSQARMLGRPHCRQASFLRSQQSELLGPFFLSSPAAHLAKCKCAPLNSMLHREGHRFYGSTMLRGVQWMIVRDWTIVFLLCASVLMNSLLKFPNWRTFET
jgi:hypothetical protein